MFPVCSLLPCGHLRGRGLTSRLLFVVFIVILLLSSLVSWDRFGTWLYRFLIILVGLDLAVLFTPSTPNRQNRNQVCWNTCSGHTLEYSIFQGFGGLDLAVPFTPFTPNRQNRNQVCWNICAGVLPLLRLPRWCRQNSYVTCSKSRWWSTAYKVLRYFSVFTDMFW